jgi:hypothetical protein
MFDIRTAIAGLYLWLLFGYLSNIVSCDIKKYITDNVYFRHFVGLISFFLLFTVVDKDNDLDVLNIWLKTCFVYFIFLLMTKSKWYFSIPTLILLIIDQSIKFQIDFDKNKEKNNSKEKNNIVLYEKMREILYNIIIFVIVIGFIHYAIRQYNNFGSKFSFIKLLLYSTCSNSK